MATAPTTGDAAETAAKSDPASSADPPDETDDVEETDETGGSGGDEEADGGNGKAARRGRLAIPRGLSFGRSRARPRHARPRRRIRLIDVLRLLGLARRAVPRPVVGPKAYPQWWQRLLALVLLVALVVVIGFVLAALVGIMVVVAGFLLEQAIS